MLCMTAQRLESESSVGSQDTQKHRACHDDEEQEDDEEEEAASSKTSSTVMTSVQIGPQMRG